MRSLGSDITIKATVEQTGGAYEVVVVDVERGGDNVPHRHPWAESYFMLDGELEVQLGRRRWTVTAGDLVVVPAKAVHGFRVVSDRASFLHTSIGPGATAMFTDFAEHFPEGPQDEADLPFALELGARHGIDVILEG